MDISSDYEDLFKILNEFKIRYLLVGGYAVMYYTEPRYTKDIDIWIMPELNDVDKVFSALAKFGAPLTSLTPEDFRDKKMILQIGVAPVRIDIMMDVGGVSFKQAWKNRKRTKYGKTSINVIGVKDLLCAKRKSTRPQDKLDAERLSQMFKKK